MKEGREDEGEYSYLYFFSSKDIYTRTIDKKSRVYLIQQEKKLLRLSDRILIL